VLWFYLALGKMTPKIESKKIEQACSQHFASYFPRAPAAMYVFVAKEWGVHILKRQTAKRVKPSSCHQRLASQLPYLQSIICKWPEGVFWQPSPLLKNSLPHTTAARVFLSAKSQPPILQSFLRLQFACASSNRSLCAAVKVWVMEKRQSHSGGCVIYLCASHPNWIRSLCLQERMFKSLTGGCGGAARDAAREKGNGPLEKCTRRFVWVVETLSGYCSHFSPSHAATLDSEKIALILMEAKYYCNKTLHTSRELI
jgi:hypothetical protein